MPAEDFPVSEMVDWKELIHPSATRSDYSSGSGSQPKRSDETSPTPTRAGLAVHDSHPLGHERIQLDNLQVQHLLASPSLATASSPASSALGHSPGSVQHEVVVKKVLLKFFQQTLIPFPLYTARDKTYDRVVLSYALTAGLYIHCHTQQVSNHVDEWF